MTRFAFVTFEGYPDLAPDDRLAADVLRSRGMQVDAVDWKDAAAPWAAYDAVVLRTCWDYYLHIGRFTAWLDELEAVGARVLNPVQVVRSNIDKRYLRAMDTEGVRIVPTRWCENSGGPPLDVVMAAEGWSAAVVKPVVSAGSYETRVVRRADAPALEEWFRARLHAGALMVQPYLPEIEDPGEWSLVFIGGRYSHAVRKVPKTGDYRVQHQYGGTYISERADAELIRSAEEILFHADGPLLYARVDGVVRAGRFHLMELELIEPSLFLDHHPDAPRRFADAVGGASVVPPPASSDAP